MSGEDAHTPAESIEELSLPAGASMRDYQRYIHLLEEQKGWLSVDLIHNCFLMGEEVGELFKAVRRQRGYFEERRAEVAEGGAEDGAVQAEEEALRRAEVAEEIVDVFNYLCAIANRLGVDIEEAFREKNRRNQARTWDE